MFKLHNQSAAYWARYISRRVGIRQGRASSLYIVSSRYAAAFEFARGQFCKTSRVAPEIAEEEVRPAVKPLRARRIQGIGGTLGAYRHKEYLVED